MMTKKYSKKTFTPSSGVREKEQQRNHDEFINSEEFYKGLWAAAEESSAAQRRYMKSVGMDYE